MKKTTMGLMAVAVLGLLLLSGCVSPQTQKIRDCAKDTANLERGQAVMFCQDEVCGINEDTIRNPPNGIQLDIGQEIIQCLEDVDRAIQ